MRCSILQLIGHNWQVTSAGLSRGPEVGTTSSGIHRNESAAELIVLTRQLASASARLPPASAGGTRSLENFQPALAGFSGWLRGGRPG